MWRQDLEESRVHSLSRNLSKNTTSKGEGMSEGGRPRIKKDPRGEEKTDTGEFR